MMMMMIRQSSGRMTLPKKPPPWNIMRRDHIVLYKHNVWWMPVYCQVSVCKCDWNNVAAIHYITVCLLCRFERDKRTRLTVLWHQCLLTFAQRYKHAISTEQKEALLRLIKIHKHKDISPEVRRELMNAPSQDVEMEEPVPSGSMMMS